MGRAVARGALRFGNDKRGVAAVEFAYASIPLFLAMFGFIGINLAFFVMSAMQNNAQYAAMVVATGQISSSANGSFSSTSSAATWLSCSSTPASPSSALASSVTSTTAEYYACSGLPSWSSYRVKVWKNCTTAPYSVGVMIGIDPASPNPAIGLVTSLASLGDSTGAMSVTSVSMKQGTCS